MKKILIATNFSDASFSAAHYGLLLACYMQTDLVLLHIFSNPIPMAIEGTPISPEQLYEIAEKDSDSKLAELRDILVNEAVTSFGHLDFLPAITIASIIGEPGTTIRAYFASFEIDLLIMGIIPRAGMDSGFSGKTLRQLITRGGMPILLVPLNWPCLPPRKIIFASAFSDDEIPFINSICAEAMAFHSDFILFHDQSVVSAGEIELERRFLNQITSKVNYPRIYYQQGKVGDLEQAIEIVKKEQQADMLVMMHRRHSVLGELIGSDRTLRVARKTKVPLLIFPDIISSDQQKEKE